MSDYTSSKGLPADNAGNPGQTYPENATASPWGRLEPLLTADQLISLQLVGIPLVSRVKDPRTNKPMVITDDMLRDYIRRAVDIAEADLAIDIMPVKYAEKFAFDKCEYESFGFFKCTHKPVYSVDRLTVRPSDNIDVFLVPQEWIETTFMTYGQINIVPLTLAITQPGGVVNSQGGGGSVFLNILGQKPWVPAFWGIEYTTGFKDGLVPTIINELVGVIAAQRILSMLAATFTQSSQSLGIDGLSQSTSSPGPQVYKVRMEELAETRKLLTNKIKKQYQQKFVVGNI